MDTNSQGLQSEPQTGKSGVLRAYALIFSVYGALIALVWAAHVPQGVELALVVLFWVAAAFGKQLTGSAEHVQILDPTFEHRIQNRYCSESNRLLNRGFKPLFFEGQAFPLFRLLLIYPALLFSIMVLNREVATVQNGSKLCFGYPIFISSNETTYAHPSQLGMKYHTLFQDGTILMTKNFGGKKRYGPTVVVHIKKNACVSDTWAEHQKHIQALETTGKQIDRDISFQAYSDISRVA